MAAPEIIFTLGNPDDPPLWGDVLYGLLGFKVTLWLADGRIIDGEVEDFTGRHGSEAIRLRLADTPLEGLRDYPMDTISRLVAL